MKTLILSILLIAYTCIGLYSQDDGGLQKSNLKNPANSLQYNDIDTKITKNISFFFGQVIKKDIDNGFDQILQNSPLLTRREDVKNLKEQTKRSIDIYGEILSFEFVSAEIVTNSYIRLRYLGLHSYYPMRWVFTYYKSPDKGWLITNIKFDDLSENFFTD
ncbi:MAG TPA: hypothetical protein PLE30_10225 [Candidatus Kapabacteria bacterium]|nr:hypothetical protein [Candidatus Kapabacteria bacterium]